MEKEIWPPNSPDLNPLDFFYWNEVVGNLDDTEVKTYDKFIKKISCAIKKVSKVSIGQ